MKAGSRILVVVFFIGVISLFGRSCWLPRWQEAIGPTPTPLTATIPAGPTDPSPLPPIPSTPITPLPSPAVEGTPDPHDCELKYTSLPEGQVETEYITEQDMLVSELYVIAYGAAHLDYRDLYALVYFNNRRALETNMYHPIDPYDMSVETDWSIFIPPREWIEEYREFPMPILYPIDSNDGDTTLTISGTSVLYPLTSQIANCFENLTDIHVEVISSNTTNGLFDYCRGVAEIFSVSEEDFLKIGLGASGCQELNFRDFEVARYALVVFTNSHNPYAEELISNPPNEDELRKLLFSAALWSDVRATWAAERIIRHFPSSSSGSFEIVKNQVFPSWNEGDEIRNLNNNDDANDLIEQVISNDYSIGIVGYDEYQKNSLLRAIPINYVSPRFDTISRNRPVYPLSRQLYLHMGNTAFDNLPLAQFFINFYLTYELDFLEGLGYSKPSQNGFLASPYFPNR